MKKKAATIEGKKLNLAASISLDYGKEISRELKRMYIELKKELEDIDFPENTAMDASPMNRVNVVINAILDKYNKRFNALAKTATKRMMSRVLKNSAVTLGMSLEDVSKQMTLKTDILSNELKEVVAAATAEAAGYIKLIPQKFLSNVQREVTNSITTGNGLADLTPALTRLYQGDAKHAKWVAEDQTRKVYNSINSQRLQDLGCKAFIWLHSGGGQHPRKEHQELSGKEFTFADPPYIGTMYGQKIYGLPGVLPRCRCSLKPVFRFEE